MNDAINKAHLRIRDKLKCVSQCIISDVIDDINTIIELERKRVKNLQLVEIPAHLLRTGDMIFDFHKKTCVKISYVEYRRKCQFNVKNDNKEMLVSYDEDEPCDYFDENTKVTVLIDIGEMENIHKRCEVNPLELED